MYEKGISRTYYYGSRKMSLLLSSRDVPRLPRRSTDLGHFFAHRSPKISIRGSQCAPSYPVTRFDNTGLFQASDRTLRRVSGAEGFEHEYAHEINQIGRTQLLPCTACLVAGLPIQNEGRPVELLGPAGRHVDTGGIRSLSRGSARE